MGRSQRGRGGLSPRQCTAILRLLKLEPPLAAHVIAQRVGVSVSSVRRFQRGAHRSQQSVDRRGLDEARLEKLCSLLAREPGRSFRWYARQVGCSDHVVAAVSRGRHITQRGK